MNKLISIIIPAYNAEKTIRKTILSMKATKYKLIEIVVVDNGSLDATADIVKGIELEAFPDIKLIRLTPNQYPWGAKNAGLEAAQGEYINFFDSDDAFVEGALDFLIEKIESVKAEVFIYGYAQTRIQGSWGDIFRKNPCSSNHEWQKWNSYFNWRELIKREIFIQNDLKCPEGFGEDIYISVMASAYAEKVCILSEILYLYTKSKDGLTANQNTYFNQFPYSREMVPECYHRCLDMQMSEWAQKNIKYAVLSWYYIMSFSGLRGNSLEEYLREQKLFEVELNKYFPDYKKWKFKGDISEGIDIKVRLLVKISHRIDSFGLYKFMLLINHYV